MVRLLKIFSHESIGRSQAAKFLYCPGCRQERTIEFRRERTFFCLFGIPLYPVGGFRETARCVACRLQISETEIEEAQQLHAHEQRQKLILVAAALLRHFDLAAPDKLKSFLAQFRCPEVQLDPAELRERLEQPLGQGRDPLLWISQQSDQLDSHQREALLLSLAPLRQAGESDGERRQRLCLIASTLGIGQPRAEAILSEEMPSE